MWLGACHLASLILCPCVQRVSPAPWGAALRCKGHVQDLESQTDELEPVTSLLRASVSSLGGQINIAIAEDDGENSVRELDKMPTQRPGSAEDNEPRGPGK